MKIARLPIYFIYEDDLPQTRGARARLRQNIKLAKCEYLLVPGTGLFTDWQGCGGQIIDPEILSPYVEASIASIPAGQRVSTSRGWSVARSALQAPVDPKEQNEQNLYHYKVSLKEIIEIAKSFGWRVQRTAHRDMVKIFIPPILTPEIEALWVKKTGRSLRKRGTKERLVA